MSVDKSMITESATDIAHKAQELANYAADLAANANEAGFDPGTPFIVTGLTVFVLACFVGYHVVWRVTPALHSPLMAITNAISSVIIVGALMAAGIEYASVSGILGFIAVTLASINIFGGFIITRRMLSMFTVRISQSGDENPSRQNITQKYKQIFLTMLGKKG